MGFVKTVRGYTLVVFLILAALATVWYVAVSRGAVDVRTLVLASVFYVFLCVLFGWVLGSEFSRGVQSVVQQVARLRHIGSSNRFEPCEMDHAHVAFEELKRLCDVTNDVGAEVVRVQARLMRKAESISSKLAETKELIHNFVYHLAHKLRTPLNSIRWAAEILKEEEDGKVSVRQRESLDELEDSAVAVLQLVQDLQDVFTFQTNGRVPLRVQSCNLKGIVDEVAGQWAVVARQKRIRMTVKHPVGGLPDLQADPVRLRRAVDDLVDNAVHYTPTGGRVSIETRVAPSSKKDPNPWLEISVRDTGIGIPKEDQSHIFEEFFRAKNAKDQWVDGTGIGLTLAKMVTEAHRGRLRFSSKEGAGSEFCLRIPAGRPGGRSIKRRRRVVVARGS